MCALNLMSEDIIVIRFCLMSVRMHQCYMVQADLTGTLNDLFSVRMMDNLRMRSSLQKRNQK